MAAIAWEQTPEIRIRPATSADIPVVARLAPLAGDGVELERPLAEGIDEGSAGAALIAGIQDGVGAFHRRMHDQLSRRDDLRQAYLNAALALVAEHHEDGVVGTLIAYPPITVIEGARRDLRMYGASPLVGVIDLVKVKAVAVAESARGVGLGSALLRRCRQVFFGCGYKLMYGQIEATAPRLEVFYRKCGFAVLDVGETIGLWPIFGFNAHVYAEEQQRLFMRERID